MGERETRCPSKEGIGILAATRGFCRDLPPLRGSLRLRYGQPHTSGAQTGDLCSLGMVGWIDAVLVLWSDSMLMYSLR